MGTTTYTTRTGYLIASREGRMRLRQRRPYSLSDLGAGEYAFELTVRIPRVARPVIAGSLTVDLPLDVDPDNPALADAAGPLVEPEGDGE